MTKKELSLLAWNIVNSRPFTNENDHYQQIFTNLKIGDKMFVLAEMNACKRAKREQTFAEVVFR